MTRGRKRRCTNIKRTSFLAHLIVQNPLPLYLLTARNSIHLLALLKQHSRLRTLPLANSLYNCFIMESIPRMRRWATFLIAFIYLITLFFSFVSPASLSVAFFFIFVVLRFFALAYIFVRLPTLVRICYFLFFWLLAVARHLFEQQTRDLCCLDLTVECRVVV